MGEKIQEKLDALGSNTRNAAAKSERRKLYRIAKAEMERISGKSVKMMKIKERLRAMRKENNTPEIFCTTSPDDMKSHTRVEHEDIQDKAELVVESIQVDTDQSDSNSNMY